MHIKGVIKVRLSQMKENQSATIEFVDDSSEFVRRFFDMGFIEGNKVKCTNIGISGSPIAYLVCGSKIALRKKDANWIKVIM